MLLLNLFLALCGLGAAIAMAFRGHTPTMFDLFFMVSMVVIGVVGEGRRRIGTPRSGQVPFMGFYTVVSIGVVDLGTLVLVTKGNGFGRAPFDTVTTWMFPKETPGLYIEGLDPFLQGRELQPRSLSVSETEGGSTTLGFA